MPPRNNIHGQSWSTVDKERQFAAMFCMEFEIFQLIRRKRPDLIFNHFDLNAGSGWNDKFSVPGSPAVFVQLADEMLGKKWHAHFFEWNRELFSQLQEKFGDHPRVTLIRDDNAEFMKVARGTLSHWDFGSVLCDPNGWMYRNQKTGEGVPIQELQRFFRLYPRMDLIANLNARIYVMMRGAEDAGLPAATYRHGRDYYGLGRNCSNFLRLFNKQYGLISSLASNGNSQWLRLILRNKYYEDYRAMGWYHLNSKEAQNVYDRLEKDGPIRLDPQLSFT